MKKWFIRISLFLILASFILPACKLLRGDPRKNCNHPKHGEYMREKWLKEVGFDK